MDYVDMLLNRLDGEMESKVPAHALVCFSHPETGRKLSRMVSEVILSRTEKSLITLLYFTPNINRLMVEEPIDILQSKMLTDFKPNSEKSKITMRLFIRESADWDSEIRKIADEQNCNLVFVGFNPYEIKLVDAEKYIRLKNDLSITETAALAQFEEHEADILKNISSLFDRNRNATCLFLDNGVKEINQVFIPVLCKADVHIFSFLYQAALKEKVHVMVWDAVGILLSDPRMQKLYQQIVKKSDGRVQLWDANKKIEKEFMETQDLLIIGLEGWRKLAATPLNWKKSLPSALIIKNTTT